MLPPHHRHCYQQFKQSLEQFQDKLNPEILAESSLQTDWQQIQQIFQADILPLDAEDNETLSYQLQAVKTEMNKQLRLLGVDITFFKAAKQPATRQQRTLQMRDRLTTLLGYCDALLQAPTSSSEPESID
jgi:hypothetical protein